MFPRKILKRQCSGLAEIAFLDIIPQYRRQIRSVFEIDFNFFFRKTFFLGGGKLKCFGGQLPPAPQ